MPAPLGLHLDHVGRNFGAIEALRDLTLTIAPAEFIAFLGPSGCGKTTLLRLIGALDHATTGAIRFDPPLTPGAISYAFQEPRLLPWRTVLGNVALPLELAGQPRAQREATARDLIHRVGLTEFTDARSHTLSGGMRMRTALARALVTTPSLLLLDEPFAALDEITRTHLDDELRALWLARPMTVVLITHSITEAIYLADRVAILAPRPGRIIDTFTVDIPQAERTPETRTEPRFVQYIARAQTTLERALAEATREVTREATREATR